MHPSRSRRLAAAVPALCLLLASWMSAPTSAADPSPGTTAAPSPVASSDPAVAEHWTWCADPGPAHATYCGSLDPALDDAGWCALLGVPGPSCYHTGSARIILRGDTKRQIEIPLRIGERHDLDLGGEVWLQYGGHGDASLTLALPATLGASTTSIDGGAPAMDWSVADVGSGSTAGCAVEASADAHGVITGTVRCADASATGHARLRLTARFRAVPLLPGPFPSPTPPATPRPTPNPDPVCGLLDGAAIERVVGLGSGTLLLLPAGAGQCVGLAADLEVAALFVVDGAAGSPLGDGSGWRGAGCAPLPLTMPELDPIGAVCTWPDGRRFIVAAAPTADAAMLVLSLSLPSSVAAGDPVTPAAIDALSNVLLEARTRRP